MARSTSPYRKGVFYLDHLNGGRSPNWYICWFDARTGQTRRLSTGTTSITEARKALDSHEVIHEELSAVAPENVRIGDLLLRYHQEHACHLPSGRPVLLHIKKITHYYRNLPVSELTVPRQEAFIAELASQELAMTYIARILRTLRAALLRAAKRGELLTVPHIHVPAEDIEEVNQARPLNVSEMARLLIAARDQSDRLLLFCLLQIGTASRPTALCELTVDQLNFDDRLIRLNPLGRKQTKKFRPVVPMAAALLPWLRRAAAQSVSGRLIEFHGKPIKDMAAPFALAVKAAGLSGKVTSYSLRRTVAIELRRRGVGAWDVAGLLGDKLPGVVERYAEYAPDYRSAASEALDTLFTAIQSEVGADLCIALPASKTQDNKQANSEPT